MTQSESLSYLGINSYEQPRFISALRTPTVNDLKLPGTQWLDKSVTPKKIYITTGSGAWSEVAAATPPSTFAWNDSATTTTMTTNNGYIVQAGVQVFTLPATSAVGDTIEVLLASGTSWQIAQAAGQSIVVNGSNTTVGAGGSITTTGAGQAIKLTCVTANTKWQTTSLIGNPTVV